MTQPAASKLLAEMEGLLGVPLFERHARGVEPTWYGQVLIRRAQRDFLLAFPWATGGAALWVLIAYRFHQSMIDAVTGGREVTREEQPRLYNLLENLCISRGIPTPKLKVMDDSALNAFATGLSPRQYSITVTSGLLQRLDDKEVEAVLGHELTHIRNGDVRMMVIAMVMAGVSRSRRDVSGCFRRFRFGRGRSSSAKGGGAPRSSSRW
jgi:heat shock protein HtpX